MIKWKTISKEIALKTDHLTIVKSDVEMPNGEISHYYYTDSPGNVIIIPVKLDSELSEHKYIMVRQYRYPVGSYDLEFPAGRRESGESILDAAARELKEETGYTATETKLLYTMYSNPAGNNSTTSICLATVVGEGKDTELDQHEEQAELRVEEIGADELHKKILSMDISDAHTMAAIAAFIMNSKLATQYLGSQS